MSTLYQDSHASIMAFCYSFALLSGQMQDQDIDVFNFDTFGKDDDLPNKDLVGPSQFSIQYDGQETFEINTMFTVSTFQDQDQFRVRGLANNMLSVLRPGNTIPYFNSKTGQRTGAHMDITSCRSSPPSGSPTRPAIFFSTRIIGAVIDIRTNFPPPGFAERFFLSSSDRS